MRLFSAIIVIYCIVYLFVPFLEKPDFLKVFKAFLFFRLNKLFTEQEKFVFF